MALHKKKIPHYIKFVLHVWSTKCWRNQKLITQFSLLCEINVLSLISQRLNNYYQIKTKRYRASEFSRCRIRPELNAAMIFVLPSVNLYQSGWLSDLLLRRWKLWGNVWHCGTKIFHIFSIKIWALVRTITSSKTEIHG